MVEKKKIIAVIFMVGSDYKADEKGLDKFTVQQWLSGLLLVYKTYLCTFPFIVSPKKIIFNIKNYVKYNYMRDCGVVGIGSIPTGLGNWYCISSLLFITCNSFFSFSFSCNWHPFPLHMVPLYSAKIAHCGSHDYFHKM